MTFEQFKEAARPFSIYVNGIALAAALFVPKVTPEKMTIVAALIGGLGYFRSVDKKIEVKKPDAPVT